MALPRESLSQQKNIKNPPFSSEEIGRALAQADVRVWYMESYISLPIGFSRHTSAQSNL